MPKAFVPTTGAARGSEVRKWRGVPRPPGGDALKTRILVVDDEAQIRNACQRVLSHCGYEVATAASGDEAAGRLEEGWDILLTDITMPGEVDGIELLRLARLAGGTDVLIMTAFPKLDTAIEAMRGQAQEYLVKPFSLEQLVQAVRNCLERRRSSQEDFGRFVTREVTQFVREHPRDFWLQGEIREVTVFFADVRRFTPFAAHASPEEARAALNEILDRAIAAVHRHGGILNKFLGDGMLAVFGAPAPDPGHPAAAAKAALELRDSVEALAASRLERGRTPLRLGIGINTGEVMAGCLGTRERAEYSVVGHAVNLAARLEEEASPGQILLGPATAARLAKAFEVRGLGERSFSGMDGPIPVFELSGGKARAEK